MGAHSAATLDVARQRVEAVRDRLGQNTENPSNVFWFEYLDLALNDPQRSGTLKAWMQRAHDQVIDTLQVTIDVVTEDGKQGDIRIRDHWAPGARRVDAARATRVLLDGSTRDYAEVTTFIATDRIYIGFTSWGKDAVQMLVFVR